jgi:hypothetical protein
MGRIAGTEARAGDDLNAAPTPGAQVGARGVSGRYGVVAESVNTSVFP